MALSLLTLWWLSNLTTSKEKENYICAKSVGLDSNGCTALT